MTRFMIYLLETGICLSLLYLAYWLFLRKETYFNFNRIYLVGSIMLALAVPVLHLSIGIEIGSSLEGPARGVSKFRQSYEGFIQMIDADFGTEPGSEHGIGGALKEEGMNEEGLIPGSSHGVLKDQDDFSADRGIPGTGLNIALSDILIIIYTGGVIYFFARFVYLLIRLYLLAQKNNVLRQDGFRIVEIREEISPFSFFRFLFINNESFDESELNHVLEHEKAHIRQKHSTDHLFAHGLAVFQWFNPFAWQIRKALKTTHEYIADRQVIDRGFERSDYQALLLKQVIGYHSVELVNNFNLKPIKNRIAMMNKTKSGLPARLKATLVAPFAILLFFFFADFTLKGKEPGSMGDREVLQGLWIGQTNDDFSPYLLISGDQFSYTEGIEIRNFNLRVTADKMILSSGPGQSETALKYECSGDRLTLWWNDSFSSRYIRSNTDNTLDHLLMEKGLHLDLPYISQYRLLEDESRFFRLSIEMSENGEVVLSFDGEPLTVDKLEEHVKKEQMKLNKIDQPFLTALFLVDRGVPMSEVDRVRKELRKMESLHIAEGGYPQGDLNLSPLIYHAVALPRLLPPLHVKVLDKQEIEKLGVALYTIDLSARNTTPRDVDEGLRKFIADNADGKYVISLDYDGATPYGQYVETVDMIWRIVYYFRNNLAMERFGAPYEKLGDELQLEIRKAYPMALSELLK